MFDGESSLGQHQRRLDICAVNPFDLALGNMSQAQMSRIQRLQWCVASSEAEKWASLFRALFPEVEVPSPCKSSYPCRDHEIQSHNVADIDLPLTYSAFKYTGMGQYDVDIAQTSLPSSPDAHDSDLELEPRPHLGGPPDLFRALSHLDQSLWDSSSPILRGQLWDEVVSSIQSALAFPVPAALNLCCEDAEDPPGGGGNAPTTDASTTTRQTGAAHNPVGDDIRKRRRGAEDDQKEYSDGEEKQRGPPRKAAKPTARLLACPFKKMFPWIFIHKRRCLGGWPDVNRLK